MSDFSRNSDFDEDLNERNSNNIDELSPNASNIFDFNDFTDIIANPTDEVPTGHIPLLNYIENALDNVEVDGVVNAENHRDQVFRDNSPILYFNRDALANVENDEISSEHSILFNFIEDDFDFNVEPLGDIWTNRPHTPDYDFSRFVVARSPSTTSSPIVFDENVVNHTVDCTIFCDHSDSDSDNELDDENGEIMAVQRPRRAQRSRTIVTKDDDVEEPEDYLTFLDPNVLDEIIGYLNLSSRLILRKVNRFFQGYIDYRHLNIVRIKFYADDDTAFLMYNRDRTIRYEQNGDKCHVEHKDSLKNVFTGNFLDFATTDLSIALRAVNLSLEFFELHLEPRNRPKKVFLPIKSSICSNGSLLNVKSFEIHCTTSYEAAEFLSYLEPVFLEKIDFTLSFILADDMTKIRNLDQWRKARSFACNLSCLVPVNIQQLFHFDTCHCTIPTISAEDLKMVTQVLLKSSTLQMWEIHWKNHRSINHDEVEKCLDAGQQLFNTIRQYPIPNNNGCYEMSLRTAYLAITRNEQP